MRIQEAAKAVGCTQRAIKFYEEKKLLPGIARTVNGYREYTDEDIKTLHAIQAYRKMGISLSDIKMLLAGENKSLLTDILSRKKADAASKQNEIAALESFICSGDPAQLNEAVDYESIAQAILEHLPGFIGLYLTRHFAPYLNTPIHTTEQKDAYTRILEFWDNPNLKLPLLYRLFTRIASMTSPISSDQMDAKLTSILSADEAAYARMRDQIEKSVRMRENPLIRYSPGEILKRHVMRSLRDCGYYDIFIPQMKRLSPSYKAYHDALDALDARICHDLNLYYDSHYNLVRKKAASGRSHFRNSL